MLTNEPSGHMNLLFTGPVGLDQCHIIEWDSVDVILANDIR